MKTGITYHKDYNQYDLGLNHPLVGDKPKITMELFKEKNIMKEIQLFEPEKATEKDLLRVHDQEYINKVKKLSKTGGMIASDTPAPIGIYDIARIPTGGTKLAGEKLFQNFEIMANPLAGFHHASRRYTSGFCFFNDVAVVIEYIREKYNKKRFLIVDLDVHHANGTQEIYFEDPTVLNISFHQDGRTLYPGTGAIDKIGKNIGKGYTVNLPLPRYTGNKSYLNAFDSIIPTLSKQFKPELIIYQCGVDTHHSDPLADLSLTYQVYYQFGKRIQKISSTTCNKLLVLFGGGYNSYSSVKSYYNIMCGLLEKKEYFKEKKIEDKRTKDVEKIVKTLKKNLSQYWNI